jgi:hypothetical protein
MSRFPGKNDILTWMPHGRAFLVHKPKEFVEEILPNFFAMSKFPSFQRQLNLYGFSRFATGQDKVSGAGAYRTLRVSTSILKGDF